MRDQPAWLAAAWKELGQKEIAGSKDNARIVTYFREAGHPAVQDDETAWCAAFLGAMLTRGGARGTGSLMARSYLRWGKAEDDLRTGAIAVLSRGSNPALGHVGFIVGAHDTSLILLGGNQTNAVTVAAFDRSRLLGVRWPDDAADIAPRTPTAATPVSEDARFRTCLSHVLEMEGGFSDDPYDPGGPTNQGIILKVFADYTGQTLDARSKPALVQQLKSIKPETVAAIYRSRYWAPAQCAALPAGLDLMHFDAAVNHGVGTAIRILQEALGVDADGEIGPITRAALARASTGDTILSMARLRERRYRALHHFWRFGRGWLRRVEATRIAALAAVGPPAPQSSHDQPSNPGDTAMTTSATPASGTKWWGHSLTVWGAIVTALAAIVPALGPVAGIDISSDMVRQLGGEIGGIVQALTGIVGTLMTLIGRARASTQLVRRDMSLRL